MALDPTGALGAILHNLSVTAGGRTLAFPYVSWGEHLAYVGPCVTVHLVSGTYAPADMGPRPDMSGTARLDVHLFWDAHATMTDADAFRAAVILAVAQAIAANPRLGDALYSWAHQALDQTSILPGGVLSYHLVMPAMALLFEEV